MFAFLIGKCSINKLNELNQAYLHKLCTNGDKVYVFRFLRLLLHCWLFRRDLDPSLSWRSDESSITRNDQSRPNGRHTLIEIDLVRLEAVCVAMLCTRWMVVRDVKHRRFSLKMLLKLALKCWCDDLNEICWCASFDCWLKMFLVLHLLRSFLKYLCEHPRVRLTFWQLMCWICWHPRVRLKFYVRFSSWFD